MTTLIEKQTFIVPNCLEDIGLLYQDDYLLLINKPSGLLSVPGKHPANSDCVITRLKSQYPNANIVHRLDMDTSGIMVIALQPSIHKALNKLFADRKVYKEYQAVVYGLLQNNNFNIELPLICDWPNRPKQKVDVEHGKYACTQVTAIKKNEDNYQTRVKLVPITGRSHQLRVHMMAINHPILGCAFYAHEKARKMATRLQLHATHLEFVHPATNEKIEGYSPCIF